MRIFLKGQVMDHIFICYSRSDKDLALKLKKKLEDSQNDVWIDLENLPPASIWRREIEEAIEGCVAFVYLLSSRSIHSPYCEKEFKYAQNLEKKIIPLILPGMSDWDVPKDVGEFQWLRWDDFGESLDHLDELLNSIHKNYEWLKLHTQLQVKESNWDRHHKENSFLLKGKELKEFEEALSRNENTLPKLTNEQRQYVRKSKQYRDRQNGFLTATAIVISLGMAALGIFGLMKSELATYNENIANTEQVKAEANAVVAQTAGADAKSSAATAQSALVVAEEQYKESRNRQLSAQSELLKDSSPSTGILLALEAIKINQDDKEPVSLSAEQALRDSLSGAGGIPLGAIKDEIQSIRISPNNRWLAVGTRNGLIYFWNIIDITPGERPEFVIQNGNNSVDILVFSSDSNLLATVERLPRLDFNLSQKYFYTTRVWDVSNGEPAKLPVVLENEKMGSIDTVMFSPDGKRLGLGSNGRVWIWNLTDPGKYQVLGAPISYYVKSDYYYLEDAGTLRSRYAVIAFGDILNRYYYIKSRGYSISIADPNRINQLYGMGSNSALSPDGEWGAIGSAQGQVLLWKIRSPNATNPEDPITLETAQKPIRVLFSPNNRWLAGVNEDGMVFLWDIDNKNWVPLEIRSFTNNPSPAFSTDGQWLAVNTEQNSVRLFNLISSNLKGDPITLSESFVQSDQKLQYVVTRSDDSDFRVYRLSASDPTAIKTYNVSEDRFDKGVTYSYKPSPDARWLIQTANIKRIFSSRDVMYSYLVVWSIDNMGNNPPCPYKIFSNIQQAEFSSDGRWLALLTPGNDAKVFIYDLVNQEKAPSILQAWFNVRSYMAFTHDGHWLLVFNGKRLYVLDLTSKNPVNDPLIIEFNDLDDGIEQMDISPNDRWLVARTVKSLSPSLTIDNKVLIFDLARLPKMGTPLMLEEPSDLQGFGKLMFSPDSHWLILLRSRYQSYDDLHYYLNPIESIIHLWDLSQNDPSNTRKQILVDDQEPALAFSPNSQWLAIESSLGVIDLQETTFSGSKQTETLSTDNFEEITSLAFNQDATYLAAGTQLGNVYLWSMGQTSIAEKRPNIMRGGEGLMEGLIFTPDGKWLIGNGFNGKIIKTTPDGKVQSVDADTSISVTFWRLKLQDLIETACSVAGRNLTLTEWAQYGFIEPYHKTCEKWPSGK